jgi:drug/metabolite transporter (DMT)-like permease
VRTALFVGLALVGFAANSLLTRGALDRALIDAPSFTIIRVAAGAITLALLVRLRGTRGSEHGSWAGGFALAAYAVTFTLAYTRIGAAVGALLLFGAVQVTMTAFGLTRGERPRHLDWLGVVLAAGGVVYLAAPGLEAPSFGGSLLMAGAGLSWGLYSVAGRLSRDPLAQTAGNFWRATPIVVAALGAFVSPASATTAGWLLAAASGALASGVGYTLWYAALPHLAAWRAALLQLMVPVVTAALAALTLGESLSTRLVLATGLVTAGVLVTARPARR